MRPLAAALACCSAASGSAQQTPALSFITLGDWGGAALGGDSAYAPKTVDAVAGQMAKTMQELHASFVVNTGDNFYCAKLSLYM